MDRYVLLDEDGKPVRYFDHAATGTVKIVEKKLSFNELLELNGECLL